jgi:hypothetical protein
MKPGGMYQQQEVKESLNLLKSKQKMNLPLNSNINANRNFSGIGTNNNFNINTKVADNNSNYRQAFKPNFETKPTVMKTTIQDSDRKFGGDMYIDNYDNLSGNKFGSNPKKAVPKDDIFSNKKTTVSSSSNYQNRSKSTSKFGSSKPSVASVSKSNLNPNFKAQPIISSSHTNEIDSIPVGKSKPKRM